MGSGAERLDTCDEELFVKNKPRSFCCRFVSCCRPFSSFLHSGKLLKFWAVALGLWRPRNNVRAGFALTFLLVDIFFLLQALTTAFVCPLTDSPLNSLFCENQTIHNSLRNNFSGEETHSTVDVFSKIPGNGLLDVVNKIALLGSHTSFFLSVWRLPLVGKAVPQDMAYSLMKPFDWLKLNFQLALFGSMLICVLIWFSVDEQNQGVDTIIKLSNLLSTVPLWTSLITCWLFHTVTSAMEHYISQCIQDILSTTHCTIDDLIRMHKKLHMQVISTSRAFKVWFIVHWVTYALATIFWCANLNHFFKLIFTTWYTAFYGILGLIIYLYVFVYPCFCAASLTGKCQMMLADLNLTTKDDWHVTHPFHHRSQLGLFLQYASLADCGYKVGNITLGSMYVVFSALLALLSVGLKLV